MGQINTHIHCLFLTCLSHTAFSFLNSVDNCLDVSFLLSRICSFYLTLVLRFCICVWVCMCAKMRVVPVRCFLWLEIHPDKMKCWCEWSGLGRRRKRFWCVRACLWRGWGRWGLRCYLLVSEACLSCTASVMLFHSSFISSTIPFSALTTQFTDTALWEVLLFGKHVCVQCCQLSYFCQVPFKLWQRLDQNQSVELSQVRGAHNSFLKFWLCILIWPCN